MECSLVPLDEFTGLKLAGLDSYDILALNFCAARGLPGTENSSLDAWFAKQGDWCGRAKFDIARHLYRFDSQAGQEPTPYSYGNSLGRFFCWHLLQVLQLHCGVKYHPDRKFKPDFCQPADVFAHGIMDDDGQGGTCASMPVVYVSMARAIGLPVYLVETRGHGFFRWDDPKGTTIRWTNPDLVLWIPPDRFNIEGAGEGIAFYPDAHYMEKPDRWTPLDYEHGHYLRSMTAKEALAGFLIERGECFWDLGNMIEALRSYHYARQLEPNSERYKWLHALRTRQYQEWEVQDRAIEDAVHKAYQRHLSEPGHGPSCQCFDCRQARETAQLPAGVPGHPSLCQCAGCLSQRQMPQTPGMPRVPNQFPNHLPHHAIPGVHHNPFPALPGF